MFSLSGSLRLQNLDEFHSLGFANKLDLSRTIRDLLARMRLGEQIDLGVEALRDKDLLTLINKLSLDEAYYEQSSNGSLFHGNYDDLRCLASDKKCLDSHMVLGDSLKVSENENIGVICLGLGCFWGAERLFWNQKGVVMTSVGYSGGELADPDYGVVCQGTTDHVEVVRVCFDRSTGVDVFSEIIAKFFTSHDPTTGMRQGNDKGTQYRSVIFFEPITSITSEDEELKQILIQNRLRDLASVLRIAEAYQHILSESGRGLITTEVRINQIYYFAERYHQQYLAKNINGYCGLSGISGSDDVSVLLSRLDV